MRVYLPLGYSLGPWHPPLHPSVRVFSVTGSPVLFPDVTLLPSVVGPEEGPGQ